MEHRRNPGFTVSTNGDFAEATVRLRTDTGFMEERF
jgi:hypothetical protein